MEHLSNEMRVTPDTPPTFLLHTDEDQAVPSENSVNFYLALRRAGVPAELHIYRTGPHGVGLAREEFIITEYIKIHPMALIHFDRVKDKEEKKKINELTQGYKNKEEFFVDKLAEGISGFATALEALEQLLAARLASLEG